MYGQKDKNSLKFSKSWQQNNPLIKIRVWKTRLACFFFNSLSSFGFLWFFVFCHIKPHQIRTLLKILFSDFFLSALNSFRFFLSIYSLVTFYLFRFSLFTFIVSASKKTLVKQKKKTLRALFVGVRQNHTLASWATTVHAIFSRVFKEKKNSLSIFSVLLNISIASRLYFIFRPKQAQNGVVWRESAMKKKGNPPFLRPTIISMAMIFHVYVMVWQQVCESNSMRSCLRVRLYTIKMCFQARCLHSLVRHSAYVFREFPSYFNNFFMSHSFYKLATVPFG